MLDTQTILVLESWLKHSFALHVVDHVLIAHFVHYGDDLADYFAHILKNNSYNSEEADAGLHAIHFLLGSSLHWERQSRPEVKRRELQARIVAGEFGEFRPKRDQ